MWPLIFFSYIFHLTFVAYLGFVTVLVAHRHPLLLVFCQLLLDRNKDNKPLQERKWSRFCALQFKGEFIWVNVRLDSSHQQSVLLFFKVAEHSFWYLFFIHPFSKTFDTLVTKNGSKQVNNTNFGFFYSFADLCIVALAMSKDINRPLISVLFICKILVVRFSLQFACNEHWNDAHKLTLF